MALRFMLRRPYSWSTQSSCTILEELFEMPRIKASRLNAQTISQLKDFRIPLLERHIDESLVAEFGECAVATNWSFYRDPFASHDKAARMIKEAVDALRLKSSFDNDEKQIAAWIKDECEKIAREIESSDPTRYESIQYLVGEEANMLTEPQMHVMKSAVEAVSKNSSWHPQVRRQVVRNILAMVKTNIT